MGISQVPPVPTPATKGDIIVGTATGPARLPVSTTANQTLLVDTTTATGLKYGSTTLTATYITPPWTTQFNITGFTYTNPNVVFTTSTTHNFAVGQTVKITGMTTTGTAGLGNTTQTITAVTGTTFTVNFGATNPGAYTSGGVAYLYPGTTCTGMFYTSVGGVYFILFENNMYYYSSDAVTWNVGYLPGTNCRVTAVDFDGTTYVMVNNQGLIFTSTTAATGSWTQRFSGTWTFTGVKWCGGNTNRWIAYGVSNATQTAPGTGGGILVASTATGTWTQATVGGSGNPSNGFVSLGFDGNQTIIVAAGSVLAVSSNATTSWTSYSNANTWQPNSTAGQIELVGPSSYPFVLWNSTASKWMAIGSSASQTGGSSTAGSPASVWTKTIANGHVKGAYFTSGSEADFYLTANQPVTFDSVNQRLYSWDIQGSSFNVYTYNANPTAVGTYLEYYPIISIASAPNVPTTLFQSDAAISSGKRFRAVYGNGKWIFFTPLTGNSIQFNSSGLITVLQ